MSFCSACGASLVEGASFCARCGAPVSAPPPAAEPTPTALPPVATVLPEPGGVVGSPVPDLVSSRPDHQTLVEQMLGGSWVPALWVAAPVLALVAGLAALAAASQLWARQLSSVLPLVQLSPNNVGAYFHAIAQQIAMALGSPLFVKGTDGGKLGHSPMLLSVAAVVTFALLLKRQVADLPLLGRLAVAARSLVLTVLLLLLPTFGATVHFTRGGDSTTLAVSPGRVLGWSLLIFGVAAVVVALRPLELLASRVPSFSYPAARATIRGAYVAVASAVALGFIGTVVAGFAQTPGSSTGPLRLLPLALGHFVDLGEYGWQVGSLGSVSNTLDGHVTLGLFDRHGTSPFYFFLLLIPVVSTLLGVLAIGQDRELDGKVQSRCAYRMALPVGVLYLLLAVPATARFDSSHVGPQVLLGLLLVVGWTFLLGFLLGQLLLRGRAARPATHVTATPWSAGKLAVSVIASVGVVLLVGGSVAAAITQGGKHAPFAPSLDLSGDLSRLDTVSSPPSDGSSSGGTSDLQDSEAQATLRELALDEETYYTDNSTYTDDETAMGYAEPSDVYVRIATADSSTFCATASGLDSSNYYTIRNDGSIEDGSTC